MRHMLDGRIIELETQSDGSVDSEALRQAAGIPEERPLIVQMPDGSNTQVNPGERVMVRPGQSFFDAPVHKRGSKRHAITDHPLATIGPTSIFVQTE